MKVLAYILTAAAVVIGADVFVMSSDGATATESVMSSDGATASEPTSIQEAPISLHGGSGMPTPPPDAY